MYAGGHYDQAIREVEDTLPHLDNPRLLSEAHLLLGKCWKGRGDWKAAIASCNAAIACYSKWKEPYLLRSACFQALYTSFLETDGDTAGNIKQDREQADIIVGEVRRNMVVEVEEQVDSMRQLFRRDHQQTRTIYTSSIPEALRLVKDGGKIFVEKGVYEVSSGASYYLLGKSMSLIGTSTRDCILLYRGGQERLVEDDDEASRLETFLIASNSNQPTIIKRFTFRNQNEAPIKTKFLGVAGGTVQIEDCIFEGLSSPDVEAVYANAKICGNFANDYPTPYLIARHCIFEQCHTFGGISALHACANIKSCLFTGCGSSAVAAMSMSKVTMENCEISLTASTETAISATSSDLTVLGCYLSGIEASGSSGGAGSCCAVASSEGAVARISNNYFYRVRTGVHSTASELNCSDNMFYSCSRRYMTRISTPSTSPTTLSSTPSTSTPTCPLCTAVSIRGQAKVQLTGNLAKYCDIGVAIAGPATPTLRQNVFDVSFMAGVFAEGGGARPIIVENTFTGGDLTSQVPRGVGILFLLNAGGLVGKNSFEDFSVSPLLVFTHCHPLLRQNRFESVRITEAKQTILEAAIIAEFQNQVETDSFFYLVESAEKEKALSDVILKGPTTKLKKDETTSG